MIVQEVHVPDFWVIVQEVPETRVIVRELPEIRIRHQGRRRPQALAPRGAQTRYLILLARVGENSVLLDRCAALQERCPPRQKSIVERLKAKVKTLLARVTV